MRHLLPVLGLFLLPGLASAQTFLDPCFTSPTVGTTFTPTANVSNNNSDLMRWSGTAWTGAWPGANITLAPTSGLVGTRAIWSGDGTVWTTGGEGFGLRLVSSITVGTTYSFNFTRVSHGTGQNGNFRPNLYTNTTGTFGTLVGPIPGVGTAWTTGTISFTATAGQAGHTFVYFHNSTGSGMFLQCEQTILPMEFSAFRVMEDQMDACLSWHIRNEMQYATHRVEASRDGEHFTEIASIPSVQAQGEGHTYTWRARNWQPPHGQQFAFRIRSVDMDGHEAFSPVQILTGGQATPFSATLLNNPAAAGRDWTVQAFLNAESSLEATILGVDGRYIRSLRLEGHPGMNTWDIAAADLPPGTWLLQLSGAEGTRVLKAVVSQ